MTKPKNFPGRKQERRRRALERLERKSNKSDVDKARIKQLKETIKYFENRPWFTKKDRSSRGQRKK